MNSYFRRALTTSRVYLVENIDYENLKDFLLEYGTLPGSVIENIDSLPNRRQKVREMLDCLSRRADVAFSTFLVSLFRSNQHHIATNLYDVAINLIDSTNFQLKDWLENNVRTILSSTSSTSSTLPKNNHNANSGVLTLKQQCNDPVENSLPESLPLLDQRQEPKPMEAEESYTFNESEPMASSLSNQVTFASSFTYSDKVDSFSSLKSQAEYSTPSSSLQQLHDNSVYQMDSSPRGLFCMITAKGSTLTGDSFPIVQNLDEKEGPIFTPKNTGKDTTKRDTELQTLFWDFGFYSCVIELEDSTLHSDKLNNIVLQFSQLPIHHKFNCCVMALLGFSAADLHLAKILSWFNEKNCPSLAGKPKLFIIQVPNDKITPSNLMSGLEIPEDALVAVGSEETDTQPGLVSSVIQVCQQMDNKSSYSVQEIFSQVQRNYSELKIAVENSLTKLWIVNPHCKLQKHEPIITQSA